MGVSMRRWMVAAVAAMAALTAPAPATMAQTNLIPGGLTAVPPTAPRPNLAQNPRLDCERGGGPTRRDSGREGVLGRHAPRCGRRRVRSELCAWHRSTDFA